MESIDRLRKYVKANTSETAALTAYPLQYEVRCTTTINDLIDAIEREVEEGYVELPRDVNGEPITFDTMIEQWGALGSIWCRMEIDGTCTWYVRGHDTSAPVMKASEVTVAKPPTVEDVLEEFASKRIRLFLTMPMGISDEEIKEYQERNGKACDELIAEFAAKLKLREER